MSIYDVIILSILEKHMGCRKRVWGAVSSQDYEKLETEAKQKDVKVPQLIHTILHDYLN